MSDLTKQAMGAALEHLLETKPLRKITISDITDACGVNRMTFYYHFHDIYELMEWLIRREAEEQLRGKLNYDSWQEGLTLVFTQLRKRRVFVKNLYRDAHRDLIEDFVFRLAEGPLIQIIEEVAVEHPLPKKDEAFIAAFFHHAFLGIILQWIREDMKKDPKEIVSRLGLIVEGSAPGILKAFTAP